MKKLSIPKRKKKTDEDTAAASESAEPNVADTDQSTGTPASDAPDSTEDADEDTTPEDQTQQ